METFTCKYCGETKSIEEFRRYYKSSGHYAYCRSCEQIEGKRRALAAKSKLNEADVETLAKINKLYDIRQANGLKTFGRTKHGEVNELVDTELSKALMNDGLDKMETEGTNKLRDK